MQIQKEVSNDVVYSRKGQSKHKQTVGILFSEGQAHSLVCSMKTVDEKLMNSSVFTINIM